MKKFNIILFVILFVSCRMIIYSQGNPKIINETEMKLTKKMINKIISVSNRNGIKYIEKIIIGYHGFELPPPGIYNNQITVYSIDKLVKDNIIEKKWLELKCNYYDKDDVNKVTHKPFQLTANPIVTQKYWRAIIGEYTVLVDVHPSTNYHEVKEIVYMFRDGKYKFDNGDTFVMLKKWYKNIGRIEKYNNKYQVTFRFISGCDTHTCIRQNNILLIISSQAVQY